MSVFDEYRSKLKTAEEAVSVVKSGDWVDYASNNGFPAHAGRGAQQAPG